MCSVGPRAWAWGWMWTSVWNHARVTDSGSWYHNGYVWFVMRLSKSIWTYCGMHSTSVELIQRGTNMQDMKDAKHAHSKRCCTVGSWTVSCRVRGRSAAGLMQRYATQAPQHTDQPAQSKSRDASRRFAWLSESNSIKGCQFSASQSSCITSGTIGSTPKEYKPLGRARQSYWSCP